MRGVQLASQGWLVREVALVLRVYQVPQASQDLLATWGLVSREKEETRERWASLASLAPQGNQ